VEFALEDSEVVVVEEEEPCSSKPEGQFVWFCWKNAA